MAKPIFLVGLPKYAPEEVFSAFQKSLENKMPEYYVIFYYTNSTEVEFKCFFEKDFDDVKFEELKKIVIDNLPDNQNFCTCIKDISDGADVNGNCIHCGKSHNPLPNNQPNS
jgi:hypothetical protein